MTAQPRLVVSAPSSGHGKTAIAVGVLAACAARRIPAAGFKVGPDHTDAAYLGLAAGRPGRNLDPRLVGAARIAPLFAHGAAGSQIAVIEGAMGLFDSLTGQPEIDGTSAVAAALRAPVLLVVDVAAMGHSVAALVHGFRVFDEMVHLGGVVLNRVASSRHEQMLRTALDDIGVPVLGALRRGDLPAVLPARAHGPVPAVQLTGDAGRAVRRLGEAVAGTIDLDRLIALAASAPALPGSIWSPGEAAGPVPDGQGRPVIAVTGGPGAPYTYVETVELLTAAGADVAVVDPLRDETLPPGVRGLVIGAGLPEGYAEELSANRRLCNAVAQLAHEGAPVIAEGVGLPWLTRDYDGRPMCAVLDASTVTGEQTVAGYREATAAVSSPLAPAGARITGYKQHRAIVTPRAGQAPAWTWAGGNPEGFVRHQVHASQLALHWAGAPETARRVVAAAAARPASAAVPSQPPPPMSAPPPVVPGRPVPRHTVPAETTRSTRAPSAGAGWVGGMPSVGTGWSGGAPSGEGGPSIGEAPAAGATPVVGGARAVEGSHAAGEDRPEGMPPTGTARPGVKTGTGRGKVKAGTGRGGVETGTGRSAVKAGTGRAEVPPATGRAEVRPAAGRAEVKTGPGHAEDVPPVAGGPLTEAPDGEDHPDSASDPEPVTVTMPPDAPLPPPGTKGDTDQADVGPRP
jgi:cobyrinic acid a,c-diamide synthase